MDVSIPDKEIRKGSFVKRSGWLFLAKLVPTLIFLAITIIYSRQLSLDDYGIFQSVWMLTNVCVVLLGFGVYSLLLSSGIGPIIQLIQRNHNKFFFFFGTLLLISGSIIFSSLSSQSAGLKFLVVSVVIIHTVSFVYESILIRANKEISIFIINLSYALLYFGWHLYILTDTYNLFLLVTGVFVLGTMRLLSYFILSQRAANKHNYERITVQHWFFIGLNEVVGVVAKWLDKLLLVYFITPAEFAVFFNGSIEIPFFGMIISVVGSLLLVEVAANLAQKEKVIQLFRETFLLLSYIVFPLFWFLFFFSDEIFHVVFSNRYNASIAIFALTILIIPVRITHYSAILQCYNKAHIILKGSLLDILIAIALMPLLYYWLGLRGVALAIVISTYIQSYYYLFHSARVLQTTVGKLVPFKKLCFRFAVTAFLTGAFSYLVQNNSDHLILIYAMIFVSVIVLCSLYLYFRESRFQLKGISLNTRKEI